MASTAPVMPSSNSSPRLVVATVDATGTSKFSSDAEIPLFRPMGPAGSSFAVFDVRNAVPVDNLEPTLEHTSTIPRCPPTGVVFCVTNIPPSFTVPMHRTLSLDYAIVLNGEITLKLDGGDERTIKAGEFIIQGGATHQWINKTEETCRIGFVMVGSEKIRLADGTELDAVAPTPKM